MTGIERIAAERQRQIDQEGFDSKHDAGPGHEFGELSMAAALYAAPKPLFMVRVSKDHETGAGLMETFDPWPWKEFAPGPSRDSSGCRNWGHESMVNAWDKRKEHPRIRQLEIAGALIAAEIDRLLAEEKAKGRGGDGPIGIEPDGEMWLHHGEE